MIEFKNRIVKLKAFKNLDNQYKSDKFIALYYKMYNYIISIPKEKIIAKMILNRNDYIGVLLNYISYFIEAKDFYCWKDRIYKLLSEKLSSTDYKKIELLYRSKAKEYWQLVLIKKENSSIKHFGTKHPSQSKIVQEKSKTTCVEKYGVEYPGFQLYENKLKSIKATCSEKAKEKRKQTNLDRRGVTCNLQSSEIKIKLKELYGEKGPLGNPNIIKKREENLLVNKGIVNIFQDPEIIEKIIKKKLELYGSIYGSNKCCGDHSKSGDEICQAIDNALGNPIDSKYAIKNGEFFLKTNTNNIRKYDYCVPSLGIIIEVDDPYWHALDKDDNEFIKFPGNKLVLAKEIHEYDKEKEELAIKNGYKIFHIRDDEYIKDPKSTINILLEQIKKYVIKEV